MSTEIPSVDDIFQRAMKGKSGTVSIAECAYLKSNLDMDKTFPVYCSHLLQAASKRGMLPRRNSAVAQTWKLGEHGANRLRPTEPVQGGALDSVNPAEAESASDIYMKSRSPAAQEKIRRLQVRTASRGARPRVDFDAWSGKEENQQDVHREVRKELVRRASRREEIKKKAPLVA